MRVDFHTNIDCCKKYMSLISGEVADMIPAVDDLVLVHRTKDKDVWLRVVRRKWVTIPTSFARDPYLMVELHLAMHESIEALEKFINR